MRKGTQGVDGMDDDERAVYCKAISKWGNEAQKTMAIEEMGELIVKLAQHDRPDRGSDAPGICEEIADVQIMMGQLSLMFGEACVAEKKRAKLARLAGRLEAD